MTSDLCLTFSKGSHDSIDISVGRGWDLHVADDRRCLLVELRKWGEGRRKKKGDDMKDNRNTWALIRIMYISGHSFFSFFKLRHRRKNGNSVFTEICQYLIKQVTSVYEP